MLKTVVKNLFAVTLLTIVLLFINAISVCAAETVASGECGTNLTWTLDCDGVLIVTGTGSMRSWNSNSSPFNNNDSIKKVIIDNSVTSIGSYAFYGCMDLTEVSIGQGVTKINSYAFANCVDLITINMCDNVEIIGSRSFYKCSNLKEIILSESLKAIPHRDCAHIAQSDFSSDETKTAVNT